MERQVNPYWRTMRKFLENRATLKQSIKESKEYPFIPSQVCINGERPLNEGLVKTYPTTKAMDYIIKTLSDEGIYVKKHYINDFNGGLDDDYDIADSVNIILDGFDFIQKQYDEVVRLFNQCGYYLSTFYWTEGKEDAVFQFEPKFRDDSYSPLKIGKYLYHVTTKQRAEKIKKLGFIPKSKNSKFNYPPRCYFFTKYDEDLFQEFIEDSLGQELEDELVVITVRTSRLDKKMKFFQDQLFVGEDIAVYTYENIPASAIVKMKKLK